MRAPFARLGARAGLGLTMPAFALGRPRPATSGFLAPLLVAPALCGGCGPPAGGTPRTPHESFEPHALDVPNPSDDPLLGWSVDGGPLRTSHARTAHARIDLRAGPLGREWLLRAAFDEGLGSRSTLDLPEANASLQLPNGAGWVAGRHGAALSLESSTAALPLEASLASTRDAAWTIECWVWPSERARGTHAVIAHWRGGGLLELLADGRIRGAAGSERAVHSKDAVEFERWNHVALVHDPLELQNLRMTLGGATSVEYVRGRTDSTSLEGLALGAPRGRQTLSGALDEFVVYARAHSSAQLAERALGTVRPGEHVLRIERAGQARDLRMFSPLAASSTLASQSDFELGELRHAAWVEGALQAVPAHWSRDEVELRPIARTTHAHAYIGKHRLLVFSGEVRDAFVPPMHNIADTWIYDLAARRWERLATDPTPRGRCHQMMAWSPDHELALLHGGWVNDMTANEILSDTWVFHTREMRWEQRHPSGESPGAVADAGLVYDALHKRFLCILQSSIHAYDPAADRWERLPTPAVINRRGKPDRFAGRSSACFAYDATSGSTLIFGGTVNAQGESVFCDRTAIYSSAQNLVVLAEGGLAPAPRVRAAVAADPLRSQFLLFGGVQSQFSTRYGDLWRLRTDRMSWQWEPLHAANTPSVRGGYYGLLHDPELDVFALVCGRHDAETFLDEVWRLQLRPGETGSATYAFRAAELAWPLELELEWLEAPGSSLRALVRSFAPERQGEWTEDPARLRVEDGELVQLRLELSPAADGRSPRVLRAAFAAQPGAQPAAADDAQAETKSGPQTDEPRARTRFALRREARGAAR